MHCSSQGKCCLFLYSEQIFNKMSILSSGSLKSCMSSIVLIKYFLRKFGFNKCKRSLINRHSPSMIISFNTLLSVKLACVLKSLVHNYLYIFIF